MQHCSFLAAVQPCPGQRALLPQGAPAGCLVTAGFGGFIFLWNEVPPSGSAAVHWCYWKQLFQASLCDCNPVRGTEGTGSFSPSLPTCQSFVRHWRRSYSFGQPFFTKMDFPLSHPQVIAPWREPEYLGHVQSLRQFCLHLILEDSFRVRKKSVLKSCIVRKIDFPKYIEGVLYGSVPFCIFNFRS